MSLSSLPRPSPNRHGIRIAKAPQRQGLHMNDGNDERNRQQVHPVLAAVLAVLGVIFVAGVVYEIRMGWSTFRWLPPAFRRWR